MRVKDRAMRFCGAVIIAALLVLGSGCNSAGAGGSGEGGGQGGATSTKTIAFDEGLSGYILLSTTGNTFVYSTDDTASSDTRFVAAGDGFSGQVERGFLSFDLSLPSGATEIVSAKLYVFPYNYADDPYRDLGGQLNAHGVSYGSSLDGLDYYTVRGPERKVNDSVADEDTWISADVSVEVKDDWNSGAPRTQFTLKFPKDNDEDGKPDRVFIQGDEDDPNAPYLEVEYR